MKSFKVNCVKNNQKIEIVVKYNSLEEAKNDLHDQWYSITEINEISEFNEKSGIFYFDAIINWNKKTGQIKSNDIFKAYLKLVEDLKYEIIYIYDKKDCDENYKIILNEKIKASFNLYKANNSPKEKEDKKIKNENTKKEELSEFLKKELNFYYGIIDKTIAKMDNIFLNYRDFIDNDKKNKLDQIYIALKQIKNLTNINKLKIIWEVSLIKIWEFELELILKNSLTNKKDILKDTNKLLKDLWSKKVVKIQWDDIFYILKKTFSDFSENYLNFKNKEKNKKKIDKNSYVYYKALRELSIYKNKLKETNINIIKCLFKLDKENINKLKLRKKLILQNISLTKNRLKNNSFSYIKIIKWMDFYKKIFLFFIHKIGDLLVYSILIFSIFFTFADVFDLKTNSNSLKILIIFSFLWLIFKISKNIPVLFFSSFLYMVFFIFLNINF